MWPQKNIKMFVDISCTDLFTQCNLPFMKVAAMLPSPCNNCFLTEIQPVIKLWKFWQLQTNRNFFWCSHFIIWWKSLGKWWKILCFINESQCIYFFTNFQWLHKSIGWVAVVEGKCHRRFGRWTSMSNQHSANRCLNSCKCQNGDYFLPEFSSVFAWT